MDADLFTEGAVYYYENKTNTKSDYKNDDINHDFLVSRPVYILKAKPVPFDIFTVNVLVITSSQRRVGIPINIDGLRNGKILPFSIRSVHTKYLTKYMGHVSDELKREVSDAVKYHLGYTKEVPAYIKEYEEQQQALNEMLNSLTLKEKSVYTFLDNHCSFKSNHYVTYNELFQEYQKQTPLNGYTRSQDFSRNLKRILDYFPSVEMKVENRITNFYGMSILSNVHKIEPDAFNDKRTKSGVLTGTKLSEEMKYANMTSEELIGLLHEKSKEVYYKLDMPQKIANYNRDSSKMEIIGLHAEDFAIIKKLIMNDVDIKKRKVFRKLDAGNSPASFNTIDQYVFYICTDSEIMAHIDHKYIKKRGLLKLKRTIRNNVKHYFTKINM